MSKHRRARGARRAPTVDAYTADVMRALKRAGARAREIAIRTGTPLVIYRNGRIQKIMLTGEPVDDPRDSA